MTDTYICPDCNRRCYTGTPHQCGPNSLAHAPDKYAGCMPDSLFKKLTPAKEREFRQWARDNWSETTPPKFGLYHPVIRHEWRVIDESMFVKEVE